jgi:hypothetical protein
VSISPGVVKRSLYLQGSQQMQVPNKNYVSRVFSQLLDQYIYLSHGKFKNSTITEIRITIFGCQVRTKYPILQAKYKELRPNGFSKVILW